MAAKSKKSKVNAASSKKSANAVADTRRTQNSLDLRKRLRLTRDVFARLLPISVRSLAAIETGKPASKPVERRLTELERVIDALEDVVDENEIGDWLQTPQQAFDGLKPLEVVERGEVDRIWQMIYFLRSGEPS